MSDLCGLLTYIFNNINIKKYVFLYIIFVFLNSEYFEYVNINIQSYFTKGVLFIVIFLLIEIFINLEIL